MLIILGDKEINYDTITILRREKALALMCYYPCSPRICYGIKCNKSLGYKKTKFGKSIAKRFNVFTIEFLLKIRKDNVFRNPIFIIKHPICKKPL